MKFYYAVDIFRSRISCLYRHFVLFKIFIRLIFKIYTLDFEISNYCLRKFVEMFNTLKYISAHYYYSLCHHCHCNALNR